MNLLRHVPVPQAIIGKSQPTGIGSKAAATGSAVTGLTFDKLPEDFVSSLSEDMLNDLLNSLVWQEVTEADSYTGEPFHGYRLTPIDDAGNCLTPYDADPQDRARVVSPPQRLMTIGGQFGSQSPDPVTGLPEDVTVTLNLVGTADVGRWPASPTMVCASGEFPTTEPADADYDLAQLKVQHMGPTSVAAGWLLTGGPSARTGNPPMSDFTRQDSFVIWPSPLSSVEPGDPVRVRIGFKPVIKADVMAPWPELAMGEVGDTVTASSMVQVFSTGAENDSVYIGTLAKTATWDGTEWSVRTTTEAEAEDAVRYIDIDVYVSLPFTLLSQGSIDLDPAVAGDDPWAVVAASGVAQIDLYSVGICGLLDSNNELQPLPETSDLDIIPLNPSVDNGDQTITEYPWFWERQEGEISEDCPYPIQWMAYSWLPGDINRDGEANVFDLQIMSLAWNTKADSSLSLAGSSVATFFSTDMTALQNNLSGYNPAADLNGDGQVNVLDLQILSQHWNQQVPAQPSWPAALGDPWGEP